MNNSKSQRDRLSELPEPLIFHIFWFMPLEDVVRTTILSKRWNKLWATTTCFNIEYHEGDPDDIRNFVNRALLLWEGTNIQKFKIDFRQLYEKLFFTDFDIWLYFAMSRKVQELYVIFEDVSYTVPQYMYSCSSLKVLSLSVCDVEVNSNVQWSQLKSLNIFGYGLTASAIDRVLRGSPQLEVLILSILVDDGKWNIQSDSLKRLSIENRSCVGPWSDVTELRIWTPKLKTLKISGEPFSKCLLVNVSSLTEISLGFCGAIDRDDSDEDDSNESVFIGKTLKPMIPTIQHVEKVTLTDMCIEVLGDMKLKDLLPSLSNVMFLKLFDATVSPEIIVPLLEIFPKLRMLVISCIFGRFVEPLELGACTPEFFLHHLRTAEITWSKYDEKSSFAIIKLVLRFAIKLEKMVVRARPFTPQESLLLVSRELLRMPRASPTAELILC